MTVQPIISYSQNLEDVLLSRVLREVESGTYIDVGAGDPEFNSVTKSFYDRGWSGINVEPRTDFQLRLREARPRDVNLELAAGESNGATTFFQVNDHAELSTTDPLIAAEYRDAGRDVVEVSVPLKTLASICAEHVSGDVHFLKIDVEGAEAEVISGADFETVRPWVLVIEVVAFGREDTSTAWRGTLESAGYRKVYFDGLNNYYLSKEKYKDLAARFKVPVNVRDNYTYPSSSRAQLTLDRLADVVGLDVYSDEHEVEERVRALLSDRIDFEKRALNAESFVESAAVETARSRQMLFERDRYIAWQTAKIRDAPTEDGSLAAMRASHSWKVTLPLRALRHPIRYARRVGGR